MRLLCTQGYFSADDRGQIVSVQKGQSVRQSRVLALLLTQCLRRFVGCVVHAGVIRTNCIDNLDRTNVVQSIFARRSVLQQFQASERVLLALASSASPPLTISAVLVVLPCCVERRRFLRTCWTLRLCGSSTCSRTPGPTTQTW